MFAHFILITWNPYVTLHIKEYPVFTPNEYFWQNHFKQEAIEAKWQVYARSVREIIANSFNFKLSNLSIEDKLEYKKLLKSKKSTK